MYRIPQVRVALVRERTVKAETRVIRCPQDAAAILREMIGDYDREAFAVLFLDTKHRVIGGHIASIGTLDRTVASPREIFRAAIMAGAKAIICGHNHPSDNPTPSHEDIKNARMLAKAGALLNVPVLDHIIVGDPDHSSLAQRGDIEQMPRCVVADRA